MGARRGTHAVIDARALVSPQAELAADVSVGPFAVIGPQVRIGARTRVAAHAVVNGPTTIGADNVIFQFASIGDAPQDKKYAGEPTRLEIGDRNVFREACTVNRGTTHDEGVTRVGSDNLFMAYTHVAHDCQVGSRIVMANYAALSGHVELPYVMTVGQPATPHSVNSEGLKRRDFSAEQIRNIREAYRILYRRDLPLEAAVKELTELAATQPELRPFVEFIAASTRSLIR
jgi:UDP-N-acetylglucosamine acyltransferase